MIRKSNLLNTQLLDELKPFFILLFPKYSIAPGWYSLLLASVIGLRVLIVFITWWKIYISLSEVSKKLKLWLINHRISLPILDELIACFELTHIFRGQIYYQRPHNFVWKFNSKVEIPKDEHLIMIFETVFLNIFSTLLSLPCLGLHP